METLELHDALVVGVDANGKELHLRLERVSVYEGDRLVRQEGGVLRLEDVHDSRGDGLVATLRLELEYGRVLDWALDNGAGRLLIEWVGDSPPRRQLSDWTFRLRAHAWGPELHHAD
ncbi:hypothetical protein L6R46_31750 [Myxococcota bacterium]|jgi:hypothetical protein|nr:hypothetical protein [Myxococcota bacterium]